MQTLLIFYKIILLTLYKNNMFYIKKIIQVVYVYFGLVSTLRVIQTGGSGSWHNQMFGSQPYPLLDWWWALIPAVLLVLLFTQFTSPKTQKIFFWIFTGITLFFMVGTYL